MGYTATVAAHTGDTNNESKLIDTAITNKSVAIILDPANASGSVGAVQKAVAANIPVILVNAEINREGLAKAQLVSNNAQGAALGAQAWVDAMKEKGKYVELVGAPSDNNAATRSNGFKTVLSQYSDLSKAGSEVANWDRTQGHNKMQSLMQANPSIQGVISGNDEMALGAMRAAREQGRKPGADLLFSAVNSSPEALQALIDGKLSVLMAGHFTIGGWALVALHDDALGLDARRLGGPDWQLSLFQSLTRAQAQQLLRFGDQVGARVDFRGLSAQGKPDSYRYPFGLQLLLH